MSWPEPATFLWALFALTLAGALLPLDVGQRHREHIVLTITATAGLAILGSRGLVLVWGAVAGALVVLGALRRATAGAAAGMVVTATAVTVGFTLAYLVHVVVLDGRFPVEVSGSGDTARAWLVLLVAWLGTMSVRTVAHGLASGAGGGHGLDPFDSPFLPYLVPLVAGTPVVAGALALYRPDDPWPALAVLAWSLPVYAVCRFDLHRRDLALRMRREAETRRRLVAIGQSTAAAVHQSRHEAGLMAWSIHRLRRLIDETPPDVRAAALAELDTLDDAKARIQRTFEEALLHEQPTAGARSTLAEVVADVAGRLAPEAQRSHLTLEVDVDPAATEVAAAGSLGDAVFNLVDNALDAATDRVSVAVVVTTDETSISVSDDGAGLPADSATRVFEPFFSTKESGTGMGLAIADAAVGELGGSLRHHRAAGTTTFVITLPTTGAPVGAPLPAARPR